MTTGVEIGLLGPVRVVVDGRPVTIAARRRVILAALALTPGRPVSTSALARYVWGEELPEQIRRALSTTVARLRGDLGVDLIASTPGGYRLTAPADAVDVHRFRVLAEAARSATSAAEADLLDRALACWRGEPLQDVDSVRLTDAHVPRLTEEWFAATERRIDLGLAAGGHADLVPQLRELTARHLSRESLWSRLMVALYRSGRQAEALEAYQTVRELLVDRLGVDPGDELRATHRAVLTNDAALAPPAAPVRAATVPERRPPRQLPADIGAFTGRAGQLADLDALLPAASAVVAVGGAGGVGKTALAVHWAHRVAGHFPDGQLYANLRGYGPGEPLPPATVLASFLDALGVPATQVPADLSGRAALLRTVLAGRRVLMLLDNARDPDHVRPLLPGSGTFVLVTSRSQLRGLVAREGARRIGVDQLGDEESLRLLEKILGPAVVAAEPDAARELVRLCGNLPLALAVAAERASRDRGRRLAELAAELRDEHERLDLLHTGDDATSDVRAVFSWSYRVLGADAARMFRLLGLHPAGDVTVHTAAALAGIPVGRARRVLDDLVAAHQLLERRPGRYEQHDLVRAYAAELAHAEDGERDRRDATRRLLAWYVHRPLAAAQRVPVALTHDQGVPEVAIAT